MGISGLPHCAIVLQQAHLQTPTTASLYVARTGIEYVAHCTSIRSLACYPLPQDDPVPDRHVTHHIITAAIWSKLNLL